MKSIIKWAPNCCRGFRTSPTTQTTYPLLPLRVGADPPRHWTRAVKKPHLPDLAKKIKLPNYSLKLHQNVPTNEFGA